MEILKTISFISLIVMSSTWTIAGVLIIKKMSLLDDLKEETNKNIKKATDTMSNTANRINEITERIFK